jgi:hypothetical protein
MKRNLLFLLILISSTLLSAQEVQKQILVEHFTNTYCSVCASRNPSFYNIIATYPEVVHIAYHPSSPYAGCPLNQHNIVENDERANFYQVYGSTPKAVLNGTVLPAIVSLVNFTQMNAAQAETTPFQIDIVQFQASSDSMYAQVTLSTVAPTGLSSANLIVLINEKALNFNAVNGENVHYDVFRKYLSNASISLPTNGNELVFTFGTKMDAEWTPSEVTTTVILQESSKHVLQSKQSAKLDFSTGISSIQTVNDAIYPNPAKNILTINNESQQIRRIELYNIIGSLMSNVDMLDKKQIKLPISNFERGSYILRIYDKDNQVFTQKVVLSD